MADHKYLSIGEVLGLLLEDFPDVTISKIRFLESQGLIEPERTPSGYRKFYDSDVELLRAILHEQKANFLPLKVIRDRIESGAIDSDSTGGRTPPRGIRNVEQREVREQPEAATLEPESRDSVFRRTDGGPEWAGGQALIPGETDGALFDPGSVPSPITAAVPIVPTQPPIGRKPVPASQTEPSHVANLVASLIEPVERPVAVEAASAGSVAAVERTTRAAPIAEPSDDAVAPVVTPPEAVVTHLRSAATAGVRELPYNPVELCEAASITAAQLAELQDYGIVSSRGSGADSSFQPEAVDIARIAGQLLAQGIDARHLRAWRQAAERESALFEQRIMPLLRQRNPQARQTALASLSELSALGASLHDALVDSLLQHHFDG